MVICQMPVFEWSRMAPNCFPSYMAWLDLARISSAALSSGLLNARCLLGTIDAPWLTVTIITRCEHHCWECWIKRVLVASAWLVSTFPKWKRNENLLLCHKTWWGKLWEPQGQLSLSRVHRRSLSIIEHLGKRPMLVESMSPRFHVRFCRQTCFQQNPSQHIFWSHSRLVYSHHLFWSLSHSVQDKGNVIWMGTGLMIFKCKTLILHRYSEGILKKRHQSWQSDAVGWAARKKTHHQDWCAVVLMVLLNGCLIAATQVAELLLLEKDLAAGIQKHPNPTDGLYGIHAY